MKYLLLLYVCTLLGYADFIDTYHNGGYSDTHKKYYALASTALSQSNYQQLALHKAKVLISEQLLSRVSSHQEISRTSHRINEKERTTSSYSESSTLDVADVALLGTKRIASKRRGNLYYLLLEFDIASVEPIYTQKANTLSHKIDETYLFYTQSKSITEKEKLLVSLKSLHENLLSLTRLKSIVGFSYTPPDISYARVNRELLGLYSHQAYDIKDLSRILVSRLDLSKIKGRVEIMPIGFEQKFYMTKFSYQLKQHLQDNLYDKVEVTKAVMSPYTIMGSYERNAMSIEVSLLVVNQEGAVIDSAMARMHIADEKLFEAHQEKSSVDTPYSIMESYLEHW